MVSDNKSSKTVDDGEEKRRANLDESDIEILKTYVRIFPHHIIEILMTVLRCSVYE
jgi:hypothetical protein